MWTIADTPLADLCHEAEPSTVTAFVADLYEARGWTVDRHDARRIVVTNGDQQTKLAVIHPDNHVLVSDLVSWAQIVVVLDDDINDDTLDAEILDIATLGQQLAYAVEPSTALQLLELRFDWTPEATAGRDDEPDTWPPSESASDSFGDAGWLRLGAISNRLSRTASHPRVFLATLLVIAVVGTAVVVADELRREQITGDGDTAVQTTSTPAVTSTARSVESTPTSSQTRSTPSQRQGDEQFEKLPPGVNQSGVINSERLLDAHESVLRNRSYRLLITYRESMAGQPVGLYTERIRIENNTQYRVDVAQWGRLQAPIPSLVGRDVYVNGSTQYEKTTGSAVRSDAILSYNALLDGHKRSLGVFLDARESSIVDYQSQNGTGSVYISIEGNHPAWITNRTGSTIVRSNGLVSSTRMEYGYSNELTPYEDVTAIYTIRLTEVDSTSLQAPEWVNETDAYRATNETGS